MAKVQDNIHLKHTFSKIRSMFMVFDVGENRPGFYQKQVAGEESCVTKFLPQGKNSVFLGSLLVVVHFAMRLNINIVGHNGHVYY